jgi:hypothetical protein
MVFATSGNLRSGSKTNGRNMITLAVSFVLPIRTWV